MRRPASAVRAGLVALALTLGFGLAFGLCGACAAPLGGEDVDVAVGASGLPGYGVTASLSQRMTNTANGRVDFAFAWTHQELGDDSSDSDEDWEQVQLGWLYKHASEAKRHWLASAGAVWLRAQSDPKFLDEPGDYAGVYLGLGYQWDTSPHLSLGPDFTLLFVEGEGSLSGGVIPQLALRLVWHL